MKEEVLMAYPGRPVDQAITSKKIIANMKEEFRKMLNIPENHQSVGVITTDYPDILRCAVDDATKKTRVEVISFSPYYGGPAVKWSANSGSAYALISGDKVADVKSAMQSIDDYVRRQRFLFDLKGDGSLKYFVGLISPAGKYFQKELGVTAGDALAYVAGPPVEAMFAIDQALKGGDVKVAEFIAPPDHDNCAKAILVGNESACKNALNAFAQALDQCGRDPLTT